MAFNIITATEEYLVKQRIAAPNQIHYFPSEASVKYTNADGQTVVEGTCLRQAYFRCIGMDGQPHSSTTEFIFGLGSATEGMMIEWWKEMGIWVADHLRWYDEEYNVAGELDCVCREPDGPLFGVELKSFYGYQSEAEIMGTKTKGGRPKINHLLQTLIYKYEFPNLDYFDLVYIGRDKARRTVYTVKLISDELSDGTIVSRPELSGVPIMDFTVEDILARYRELDTHVKAKEPPPKDYKLRYDEAEIKAYHEAGKLSDNKYKKWQKCKSSTNSDWPGDWQCSYCTFTKLCWSVGGHEVVAEGNDEEVEVILD